MENQEQTDNVVRCCIDRYGQQRAIAFKASLWKPGDTIDIMFVDRGIDKLLIERTIESASEWMKYTDLVFNFRQTYKMFGRPDVKITFNGEGSWSYIGTECRNIMGTAPTMCFGWLDMNTPDEEFDRVVKHEFGHMLGLMHEHQNPTGGIQWNEELVYKYFSGPPNFWDRKTTEQNVLLRYGEDCTNSAFDPESIMLYPIDRALTTNGFGVGWNNSISEHDIETVSKLYRRA